MAQECIVNINLTNCLIDYYDKLLIPCFLAPLTSKGKKLLEKLYDVENGLKEKGFISNNAMVSESRLLLCFDMHNAKKLENASILKSNWMD